MQSINFEFLRPQWNELASLAGFAEVYAHSDAVSAHVKLRTFGEQLVQWVYDHLKLPHVPKANQNDLLQAEPFKLAIPRVVVSKLHALRIHGNHAAHGDKVTTKNALWLLREAHDLGKWIAMTYGGAALANIADYTEPPAGGAEGSVKTQLRREKKRFLEQLAAQEAQMQKLLTELETARAPAEHVEASATEWRATAETAAQAGRRSADVLQFNEAETRRQLIDSMLADAKWDLANPDEVGLEVEVSHQPTDSGKGWADYVLYGDNGKPLAVIEAKKTAIDPEIGRTQAKCYADGLERQHGQRPLILYTNGFDIWVWNDQEDEPPRRVFGFYSKDSLGYRVAQRTEKLPQSQIGPKPEIVDRLYQIEAVRKVIERFAAKHRKALIVQATGTGKTRVAIALSDALIRAKWARRILFLSDRRELRKQAHNTFKEFLPAEPRTFVTANTADDRDKRIYLATYPAMMKCFENFDIGFFDLIIADESHRSIYNRYRDIFLYYDALQVGLTATPRDHVGHDTYKMFHCETNDPTFNYDYREAVDHNPPYLVPFEVDTVTTPFLRDGISYSKMSAEQREVLDEEEPDPATIEYDQAAVDKRIFNKDTNRFILRNLMENGIRDTSGSRVGKSIIFARNHNHAVLLQNLFDEMYPQFGGKFCRLIDNYDPRAEDLIDDLKGLGTNPDLTIAISVDMLDTGIDVPEVVNLVFAKPVYSYVKFWQMIGRGTRLCRSLFGPGKDKTHFMIFDHWKNFEWFEEKYKPAEPSQTKSLTQLVFEGRIRLADAAISAQQLDALQLAVRLIGEDINALPERSVAVREKWREVKSVGRPEVLQQFDAATKAILQHEVGPLMQWINISGHEAAHQFDNLIVKLQTELLKGSSKFQDLKDEMLDQISTLPINLTQVQVKVPVLERIKRADFWNNLTVLDLEEVRSELRGIMRHRSFGQPGGGVLRPKVIDVREDGSLVERKRHNVKLEGLELVAYRHRVLKILTDLFEQNDTLQKIKAGQPVTEADLDLLCSLVLTQDPQLDLHDLLDYYPDAAGHLDKVLRGIIGLDARAVHEKFSEFVHAHPNLASHQIKFLDLLQNHISKYGSIEVGRLYEPPFTLFHSDGLDGVFDENLPVKFSM